MCGSKETPLTCGLPDLCVWASRYVGTDSHNKAYLADPRTAHKGARGLGWTTNSGNYYGADGSQGTVLNVNTTQGKRYKLTLYVHHVELQGV